LVSCVEVAGQCSLHHFGELCSKKCTSVYSIFFFFRSRCLKMMCVWDQSCRQIHYRRHSGCSYSWYTF